MHVSFFLFYKWSVASSVFFGFPSLSIWLTVCLLGVGVVSSDAYFKKQNENFRFFLGSSHLHILKCISLFICIIFWLHCSREGFVFQVNFFFFQPQNLFEMSVLSNLCETSLPFHSFETDT